MNDSRLDESLQRLKNQTLVCLTGQAQHASRAQEKFLEARLDGLRRLGELARLQAELAGALPAPAAVRPVLFGRAMLEEFASGSIERCLGPQYAIFAGRRVPRIPNGALLVMDRVLEIQGTLGQSPEIITEYDVPADAWFCADSASGLTPYAILMEMALQPCGFLSAYLGTILIFPDSNLYFRNLDGEARITRQVDLRGKTVRARARMTGHIVDEETVIQKFDFRLEADQQVFFEGRSVFGFFSAETMARQAGLDGGKESLPAYLQSGASLKGSWIDLTRPNPLTASTGGLRLATGRLNLLAEIYLEPGGGEYGQGYIYASRPIRAQDWYFANHFHQDPVMPGSLGVEAILEALRIFALAQGLGADYERPVFQWVDQHPFYWKYRGQILATTGQMFLEIQVRRVEETPDGIELAGDASSWAGRIRIYHAKNVAIRIVKGS
jgi:3-hydroxymyristoyl/3-hydroxydecanoyl-(acyl carrier protein) dehydratase